MRLLRSPADPACTRRRTRPPRSAGRAHPRDLDALRAAWPEIVAAVRARSRFLGEALARTAPAALELPWLTVALARAEPALRRAAAGQARLVEEVLRPGSGSRLRLRVTDGRPRPGRRSAARGPAATDASLKADRLRAFRTKDPTLDTAADALDLEIVD